MRKLTYAINLTLDGCCDHTKGIADEEVHDFFAQLLLDADTFVNPSLWVKEGVTLQEKLQLVGSRTFKSGCVALHKRLKLKY